MSELSVTIWRRSLQLSEGRREAFQQRLEALIGGLQHNVQRMVTAAVDEEDTDVRRCDEAGGRGMHRAASSGRGEGSHRGRSGSESGSVGGRAAAVGSVSEGDRTIEGLPVGVGGMDTGPSGRLEGQAAQEDGGRGRQPDDMAWGEEEEHRAAQPDATNRGGGRGACEDEFTPHGGALAPPAPALRLFGSNIRQHQGDTGKE